MLVDCIPYCPRRGLSRNIDMGDLSQGMDAGISAPCPLNTCFLTTKGEHRSLQGSLNGRTVWLPLPAHKRPAIVFDCQLPALHPCDLLDCGD